MKEKHSLVLLRPGHRLLLIARHQLLAARQEQQQEENWLKERILTMDVPGRSCFAAPDHVIPGLAQ